MKLGWPFRIHFTFGFDTETGPNYEPETNRERALRWATDRDPANSLTADAAVKAAEVYEAYLNRK